MKRLHVIGIFLLFLFCNISFTTLSDENSGILSGKTPYVGGSGPGNYTRIQDAIDNASDGATIYVYSGFYQENIVINKSLILHGENNEDTIIDGSRKGDVIYISNDDVKIMNFSIQNSGGWSEDSVNAAIELYNVENCCIENNIIVNNNGYFVVFFKYSNRNYVIDNNFLNNDGEGIKISCSDCNFIDNNIFINNSRGIDLSSSDDNVITNNSIINCSSGIGMYRSTENVVSSNFVNDSGRICIRYSSYTKVFNNTLKNSGIEIEGDDKFHWNTHDLSNNSINGEPVCYLKNKDKGIVSDGYSEVILANCSNVTVENQRINNLSIGVLLGFSSYCTVLNNTIQDNLTHGVSLRFSHHNHIKDNFITDSSWNGIWLINSNNNIVSCNYLSNNDDSIALWYSNDNLAQGNNIDDGDMGVFLTESERNVVMDNNILNASIGIELDYSFWNLINDNNIDYGCIGIDFSLSSNNSIGFNTINDFTKGIDLDGTFRKGYSSDGNVIHHNEITNNDIGVDISWYSSNNIIYHNNFINNSWYNALDFNNNSWFNASLKEGNYWDDYNGLDENNDRIGDIPYNISNGNKDLYPLIEPYRDNKIPSVDIYKPFGGVFINDNLFISFLNDKFRPNIPPTIFGFIKVKVHAFDEDSGIKNVSFFVNGEILGEDKVEPYECMWDKICFGKYTIKVIAFDLYGNRASDEIEVWKFF